VRNAVGRPRRRWEGNIEMGVKEIRCEDLDWIHLAQETVQFLERVNTIMKLWVP